MATVYVDQITGVSTSPNPVDAITGNGETLAYKAPCRVATTGNITLSGAQTIDGVAVVSGDRILVRAQTNSVGNGIWIVSSGVWSRARDFDSNRDVTKGTRVTLTDGSTLSGKEYMLSSSNPIQVGTSNITFTETLSSDAGSSAAAAQAAQAAAEAAQAGAESAETAAGDYASAASTSAGNAATSESNATASASDASGFASAASASAGNASTSETNAANSASAAQTAETNAETAEANAVASAAVASGAMTTVLDPQFATKATAEAYNPTVAPDYIRTAGYTAAGDGGGALYKKAASEPPHGGKFQSADGTWWEIAENTVRLKQLGATTASGSSARTTNDAAIAAAIAIAKPWVVDGIYEYGTAIVATTNVTGISPGVSELKFYGTGIAFSTGARVTGDFTLRSGAASQSGFRQTGGTGPKIKPLRVLDFDGEGVRFGVAGTSGVYFADVDFIEINNTNTTGTIGFIVDGLVIPNSNANIFRNVFVKGNWGILYDVRGNANVFIGGDAEPNNSAAAVSAVYKVQGIGNKFYGPYIEPTGATMPALFWQFTSGANSNFFHDIYLTRADGNVARYISDSGAGNEIHIRPNSANFPTHGVNETYANLVPNSRFQIWDASRGLPDGWGAIFGASGISQETGTVRGSAFSVKMDVTSDRRSIQTYIATNNPGARLPRGQIPIGALRGRTVTAAAWCLTTTTGMGGVKINGAGSNSHSGSGAWELLVAQTRIGDSENEVSIDLRTDPNSANNTGVVYYSEPIVVIGNSVPAAAPARALVDSRAFMMGRLVLNNPLTLTPNSATPSVELGNIFKTANTGATSITNFTDGAAGQRVTVFCQDANTTLVNNSNITTTTGSNKSLSNGAVYELIHNGTKWVEK